jgi:hypothetical protein
LKLDTARIRGLLVKATEAAMPIRSRIEDGSLSAGDRELATATIALMEVLDAVVEAAILPMAGSIGGVGSLSSAASGPPSASGRGVAAVEPGLPELKAALATADKTAVVFDADLGQSRAANRNTLNGSFTAGIRAATLKRATDAGEDVSETVRVVNDALSCAENLDFLGESSSKKVDKRDPNNPIFGDYFTMPIKVDFPDRNTRINFERVMRRHCGLRVSMSLPKPIRKYQGLFLKALRERYAGRAVMARPDVSSMTLVAFHKKDGDKRWERCPESVPIPSGIMLPDFSMPGSVTLMDRTDSPPSCGGGSTVASGGGEDDALSQ